MALMPVPSRHLGAAKWTFAGLGSDDWLGIEDIINSSLDPGSFSTPSTFGGYGIQADSAGNFFNPSNPNNAWFGNSATGGPASSGSDDWATILGQALATAGQVARVAVAPAGSTILPNGTVLPAGYSVAASSIGSMLPIILIGGAAILLLSMGGHH